MSWSCKLLLLATSQTLKCPMIYKPKHAHSSVHHSNLFFFFPNTSRHPIRYIIHLLLLNSHKRKQLFFFKNTQKMSQQSKSLQLRSFCFAHADMGCMLMVPSLHLIGLKGQTHTSLPSEYNSSGSVNHRRSSCLVTYYWIG